MKKVIVIVSCVLLVSMGVFSILVLTSPSLPSKQEISSAVIHNRMRNATMSISEEDSKTILELLKRKTSFKFPLKQAYLNEIKFIGEDGAEIKVVNVESFTEISDEHYVKIDDKTYKVDKGFYEFLSSICRNKDFPLD